MKSSENIFNLLLFYEWLKDSNEFIDGLSVCEFIVCDIIEGLDDDKMLWWYKMGDGLSPDELLWIDWHDVIDKGEFSTIATRSQTSQLHQAAITFRNYILFVVIFEWELEDYHIDSC